MNGQTAKIINKAAQTYRMKSRRLKRAYNELNHIEKGQAKADMFTFCMGLKKAAAGQAKKVRKERDSKVKSEKAKVKGGTKARTPQPATRTPKPPILRRIIAWVMLKLGFWNWGTSYRYERNFESKKESA